VRGNNKYLINLDFLEDQRDPRDKYYREYVAFINDEAVQKDIAQLRKIGNINHNLIKDKLRRYSDICEQANMLYQKVCRRAKSQRIVIAGNSPEYLAIEKEFRWDFFKKAEKECFDRLQEYVNARIKVSDVQGILKKFNKPISWEESLRGYILTGVVIRPSVRYLISLGNDRITLEIYPETTKRDLDKAFSQIKNYQPYLQGWGVKSKRVKRNLNQDILDTIDYREYKSLPNETYKKKDKATGKIFSISNKRDAKLDLVVKRDPEVYFLSEQRRIESKLRKTYERNIKYINKR